MDKQGIKERLKRKKKKFIILFWSVFSAAILTLVILFTLINNGYMGFMPSFEQLENPKSAVASQVISADQEVLGKYYKENRTIVDFDDLPKHLINALIATEDIRYYKHTGIDWLALGRVAYGIVTGKDMGGGSTITQQLAKNLFPRKRSHFDSKLQWYFYMIKVKFKEWITAVKLEKNYTKKEILTMYFNNVFFGSQSFGIKSAANTFFNSSLDSLKTEEAALLVGVLKAPSRYSPVISERTRENSLQRRNLVLNQMAKYDFISESTSDSLQQLPIKLNYNVSSHNRGLARYFREYVRKILTTEKPVKENYPAWRHQQYVEDSIAWQNNPLFGWCKKNRKANGETYNLYSDGLKIYTTINSKMQRYAENAVKNHLKEDLQPAFEKTKRNSDKWPFSESLSQSKINQIIQNAVRRSERYRVLRNAGLSEDSIMSNFKKPVKMNNIFTWEGEKDTVMSPMDSILHYKKYLQAGFMSMEPQTGYVRAYVGGINYDHYQYDNVNLARRQIGSTIKPFLYTMAMMPGEYDPCDKVPNANVHFKLPNDSTYSPRYSTNDKEGQMVTLRYGLSHSLNQISAFLMKQYGPKALIKIMRKMGIQSPLPPVPSLAVGAAEIKLSEMIGAYGTFPNKGVYAEPVYITRIEDRNGNVVARFTGDKREVMDTRTAYKMLKLMRSVVNNGTSIRLRYKYNFKADIAGKTGTTNNNSDGWFIGNVPDLVSGAWVGGEVRSIHFDNIRLGQGANMALPIWARYMKKVFADSTNSISPRDSFPKPENLNAPLDCFGNQNTDTSEVNKIQQGEDLF